MGSILLGKTMIDGTVYNINSSTQKITFYVYTDSTLSNTLQYTAEKGMTWADYVNSSYNTGAFTMVQDSGGTTIQYIYWNNHMVYQPDGSIMHAVAEIKANGIYRPSFCCFVAGTQVLISLDGDTKSIENVEKFDTVVSYDIHTGKDYLAYVQKVIINYTSVNMAKVIFDNGYMLEMTDYHPIYTQNGWRSITDQNYERLVVGDMAKTIDGWSKVVSIALYRLPKPIATYTLAVTDYNEYPDDDKNDNFYANGIVVHNAGSDIC